MTTRIKNVVLLAGGIGGAKLAEGLSSIAGINLSIIGNIADDDVFHGLVVSPDIDTLTYTLSGLVDRSQGWGVKSDQYRALSVLKQLGSPTWMSLGDADLGLHIYRTERLRKGDRPSIIARDIAGFFDVKANIILPTDEPVRTRVKSSDGWMSFQEYFVKMRCSPEIVDICYDGINEAKPTAETVKHLEAADVVIIAPSNPIFSIAPILDIPGIKDLILAINVPKLAVSPIIAGKAVKGPAIEIMKAKGMIPNSFGVASYYKDLVETFVLDSKDEGLAADIESLGLKVNISSILMKDYNDKKRLSEDLIAIAASSSSNRRQYAE